MPQAPILLLENKQEEVVTPVVWWWKCWWARLLWKHPGNTDIAVLEEAILSEQLPCTLVPLSLRQGLQDFWRL